MSTLSRIPPFKLIPEPLSEEARTLAKFRMAPDNIGTRHQLGGTPEFIQDEQWPRCSECSNKMTFYGQLDSINDDYILADCGLVYVFVCFDCNETSSFIQSY